MEEEDGGGGGRRKREEEEALLFLPKEVFLLVLLQCAAPNQFNDMLTNLRNKERAASGGFPLYVFIFITKNTTSLFKIYCILMA